MARIPGKLASENQTYMSQSRPIRTPRPRRMSGPAVGREKWVIDRRFGACSDVADLTLQCTGTKIECTGTKIECTGTKIAEWPSLQRLRQAKVRERKISESILEPPLSRSGAPRPCRAKARPSSLTLQAPNLPNRPALAKARLIKYLASNWPSPPVIAVFSPKD